MEKVSYSIDDNGTMHIFIGTHSVADISDCNDMDKLDALLLIDDVMYELGIKY